MTTIIIIATSCPLLHVSRAARRQNSWVLTTDQWGQNTLGDMKSEGAKMDKPIPMRHCANCGVEMGRYRDYHRLDTCGKPECDREARNEARAEREEAHDRLDRDMDW